MDCSNQYVRHLWAAGDVFTKRLKKPNLGRLAAASPAEYSVLSHICCHRDADEKKSLKKDHSLLFSHERSPDLDRGEHLRRTDISSTDNDSQLSLQLNDGKFLAIYGDFDASNIVSVVSNAQQTLLLSNSGDVYQWWIGDSPSEKVEFHAGATGISKQVISKPSSGASSPSLTSNHPTFPLPATKTPVLVSPFAWERAGLGQKIVSIACGPLHCVALSAAPFYDVYTWGCGLNGRLGHGTEADEASPRIVMALMPYRVSHIAAGGSHTAVITMGRIEMALIDVAEENALIGSVQELNSNRRSRGHSHDMLRLDSDDAFDSDEENIYARSRGTKDPLPAVHRNFLALTMIRRYNRIANRKVHPEKSIGAVWTWGNGANGRLGHGDTNDSLVPKRVRRLRRIRSRILPNPASDKGSQRSGTAQKAEAVTNSVNAVEISNSKGSKKSSSSAHPFEFFNIFRSNKDSDHRKKKMDPPIPPEAYRLGIVPPAYEKSMATPMTPETEESPFSGTAVNQALALSTKAGRVRAISVHCGRAFTVLVTSDGDVWTWGRGAEGQTGLDLQNLRNRYENTSLSRYISPSMDVLVPHRVRFPASMYPITHPREMEIATHSVLAQYPIYEAMIVCPWGLSVPFSCDAASSPETWADNGITTGPGSSNQSQFSQAGRLPANAAGATGQSPNVRNLGGSARSGSQRSVPQGGLATFTPNTALSTNNFDVSTTSSGIVSDAHLTGDGDATSLYTELGGMHSKHSVDIVMQGMDPFVWATGSPCPIGKESEGGIKQKKKSRSSLTGWDSASALQEDQVRVAFAAVGHSHVVVSTREGRVWSWGGNSAEQVGRSALNAKFPTPVEVPLQFFLEEELRKAMQNQHEEGETSTSNETNSTKETNGSFSASYTQSASTPDSKGESTGGLTTPQNVASLSSTDSTPPARRPKLFGELSSARLGDSLSEAHASSFSSQVDDPSKASGLTSTSSLGSPLGAGKDSDTPVPDPIVRVFAGAFHSMAVTAGGFILSWGFHQHGQLGAGPIGAATSSPTPVVFVEGAQDCLCASLEASNIRASMLSSPGFTFPSNKPTAGAISNHDAGASSNSLICPANFDSVVIGLHQRILSIACGTNFSLVLAEHKKKVRRPRTKSQHVMASPNTSFSHYSLPPDSLARYRQSIMEFVSLDDDAISLGDIPITGGLNNLRIPLGTPSFPRLEEGNSPRRNSDAFSDNESTEEWSPNSQRKYVESPRFRRQSLPEPKIRSTPSLAGPDFSSDALGAESTMYSSTADQNSVISADEKTLATPLGTKSTSENFESNDSVQSKTTNKGATDAPQSSGPARVRSASWSISVHSSSMAVHKSSTTHLLTQQSMHMATYEQMDAQGTTTGSDSNMSTPMSEPIARDLFQQRGIRTPGLLSESIRSQKSGLLPPASNHRASALLRNSFPKGQAIWNDRFAPPVAPSHSGQYNDSATLTVLDYFVPSFLSVQQKEPVILQIYRMQTSLLVRMDEEAQWSNVSEQWSSFLSSVVGSWELALNHDPKVRTLLRSGTPPHLRYKIWPLCIGNNLRITPSLFQISQKRGRMIREIINEQRSFLSQDYKFSSIFNTFTLQSDSADNNSSTNPSKCSRLDQLVGNEFSVEIIDRDLERTFGAAKLFGPPDTHTSGPLYSSVRDILQAFVAFRPDLGYVQGMGSVACLLAIHILGTQVFASGTGTSFPSLVKTSPSHSHSNLSNANKQQYVHTVTSLPGPFYSAASVKNKIPTRSSVNATQLSEDHLRPMRQSFQGPSPTFPIRLSSFLIDTPAAALERKPFGAASSFLACRDRTASDMTPSIHVIDNTPKELSKIHLDNANTQLTDVNKQKNGMAYATDSTKSYNVDDYDCVEKEEAEYPPVPLKPTSTGRGTASFSHRENSSSNSLQEIVDTESETPQIASALSASPVTVLTSIHALTTSPQGVFSPSSPARTSAFSRLYNSGKQLHSEYECPKGYPLWTEPSPSFGDAPSTVHPLSPFLHHPSIGVSVADGVYLTFQSFTNLVFDPRYHFHHFYAMQRPVLAQYYVIFTSLFEYTLPALANHLKQSIVLENYISRWLSCAFLADLPLRIAARLFDGLLVEGTSYLFRAALCILERLGPALMSDKIEPASLLNQTRYGQDEINAWDIAVGDGTPGSPGEIALMALIESRHLPPHIELALAQITSDPFFYRFVDMEDVPPRFSNHPTHAFKESLNSPPKSKSGSSLAKSGSGVYFN